MPVALSGGKSEKTEPVPPDTLSTQPLERSLGDSVERNRRRVAIPHPVHLILAQVRDDPDVVEVERDDAQERLFRGQGLAELDGPAADDPALGGTDQAIAQVDPRRAELRLGLADLAPDGLEIGDADVGLELLGLGLADRRAALSRARWLCSRRTVDSSSCSSLESTCRSSAAISLRSDSTFDTASR